MNQVSKLLAAMLFMSLVAPSFAHAKDIDMAIVIAKGNEAEKCTKLQSKAADYNEWSIALEDFSAMEKLSPKKTRRFAKLALNKIYEDIYAVQDLVGITEELTVVVQAKKLLKRVKSIETDEANELMLDKLNQLDRAMFDTLQEASQSLTDCKIPAGRFRASEKKSSASESEPESALVQ